MISFTSLLMVILIVVCGATLGSSAGHNTDHGEDHNQGKTVHVANFCTSTPRFISRKFATRHTNIVASTTTNKNIPPLHDEVGESSSDVSKTVEITSPHQQKKAGGKGKFVKRARSTYHSSHPIDLADIGLKTQNYQKLIFTKTKTKKNTEPRAYPVLKSTNQQRFLLSNKKIKRRAEMSKSKYRTIRGKRVSVSKTVGQSVKTVPQLISQISKKVRSLQHNSTRYKRSETWSPRAMNMTGDAPDFSGGGFDSHQNDQAVQSTIPPNVPINEPENGILDASETPLPEQTGESVRHGLHNRGNSSSVSSAKDKITPQSITTQSTSTISQPKIHKTSTSLGMQWFPNETGPVMPDLKEDMFGTSSEETTEPKPATTDVTTTPTDASRRSFMDRDPSAAVLVPPAHSNNPVIQASDVSPVNLLQTTSNDSQVPPTPPSHPDMPESITVTVNTMDFSKFLLSTNSEWKLQNPEDVSESNADEKADCLILQSLYPPTPSNTYVNYLLNIPLLQQSRHLLECRIGTPRPVREFIYAGWHHVREISDNKDSLMCLPPENITILQRLQNSTTKTVASVFQPRHGTEANVSSSASDDKLTVLSANSFSFYFDPSVSKDAFSDYMCIAADKDTLTYVSPAVRVARLNVITNQTANLILPSKITRKSELPQDCLGLKSTSGLSIDWFQSNAPEVDTPWYDLPQSVTNLLDKSILTKIANISAWQDDVVKTNASSKLIVCKVYVNSSNQVTDVGLNHVKKIYRFFRYSLAPANVSNNAQPKLVKFPAVFKERLNLTCQLSSDSRYINLVEYSLAQHPCSSVLFHGASVLASQNAGTETVPAENEMCFKCQYDNMHIFVDISVESDFSSTPVQTGNTDPAHSCIPDPHLAFEWSEVREKNTCILPHTFKSYIIKQMLDKTLPFSPVSIFYSNRQLKVCLNHLEGPDAPPTSTPFNYALFFAGFGFALTVIIVTILLIRKKCRYQFTCSKKSANRNMIKSRFQGSGSSQLSILSGNSVNEYQMPSLVDIHSHEMVQRSKIALKDVIRNGHHGCVYKALVSDLLDGEEEKLVAVKVKKRVKGKGFSGVKKLSKEAEVLRKIPPHPNLVKYMGCSLTFDSEFIITELVDGVSLLEYVSRKREELTMVGTYLTPHVTHVFSEALQLFDHHFTEGNDKNCSVYTDPDFEYDTYNVIDEGTEDAWKPENGLSSSYINERNESYISKLKHDYECATLSKTLWSICLQIAQGMEHLHSLNIIHGNLSAKNVLLQDQRASVNAKICDFGLAHRFLEGERQFVSSTDSTSTTRWMSPETVRTRELSYKTDVWTYGVTLWETVSLGDLPFSDVKDDCVSEYILKGERPEKPECCDDCVYNLLKECWHFQPEDRPSFTTLIQWWTNLSRKTIDNFRSNNGEVDDQQIYCEIDHFDGFDTESAL